MLRDGVPYKKVVCRCYDGSVQKDLAMMRKMMLFIIFCCAVGCGAIFSFCYFWADWPTEEGMGVDDASADAEAPPEKKLHGKQLIDGETYYYDRNGERMTGLVSIDGYFYYFGDDGVMQKSREETVSFGGVPMSCYINDEGKLGFVAAVSGQEAASEQGTVSVSPLEGSHVFDINEVRRGVAEIMARYGGKTSVYFNDLKTNQTFSLNDTSMYPCCMIKTAALSAFMQRVEEGHMDYGRYQSLIGPMIIYSDNTSYNRLMRGLGDGSALLGAAHLNEYCRTVGMSHSAVYHGLKPGSDYFTAGNRSNVSSANDIGRYFEMLYYGRLASPAHTGEMLSLYAQCIDREGIAQGLPEGIVYAHKTGEAYACYHDGGIVYAKDRPYIVVAFTDGVPNNRAFMKALSSYLYRYQMTTVL